MNGEIDVELKEDYDADAKECDFEDYFDVRLS